MTGVVNTNISLWCRHSMMPYDLCLNVIQTCHLIKKKKNHTYYLTYQYNALGIERFCDFGTLGCLLTKGNDMTSLQY